MVASGVPEENDHHAAEIAKMALDLLAKVVTFEVQHKPGYRLRLRMGIHSGSCVAGVVGTKIPHYSVFGETVEIAGLMEATSEPMKIQASPSFAGKKMKGRIFLTFNSFFLQMTDSTTDLLSNDGSFNYIERDPMTMPDKLENIKTYWLIGRTSGGGDHQNQNGMQTHEKLQEV